MGLESQGIEIRLEEKYNKMERQLQEVRQQTVGAGRPDVEGRRLGVEGAGGGEGR